MCMCAYTSPIVLLMETQPNPAFDEPFVSWTYVFQRSESIVILCSYYTDGHTIAHRSRFVCFWGKRKTEKKKKKKKEEKEVLASGMQPVLSAVMLFCSSPPLTFITPIKISPSHSFAFVLIIR